MSCDPAQLGASLSSDVDFKVVLDDEALAAAAGWTEQNRRQNMEKIIAALKKVFEVKDENSMTVQKIFSSRFFLTLEVEKFTVKSISAVRADSLNNDIERNFLSTVLYNSSFISGEEGVYKNKFKGLIENSVRLKNDSVGLLARNWQQVRATSAGRAERVYHSL